MLKFNKFADKQRAAEIETIGAATDDGNAVMETANYYFDEKLKRRYKILKTVKIITWVALSVIAAAVIILKIIL